MGVTRLAERVEVVLGVDTHKHQHAAAVVSAVGGVLGELEVPATAVGYAQLLRLADAHPGRRAWAIEGTASYGVGLTRFLQARGEEVLEVDRPKRERRRMGAKSDPLDAARAAREALGRAHQAAPREGGRRAALGLLLAARRTAVDAATAAERQMQDLVVRAPEPLRAQLRGKSPRQLLAATVLCAWSHPGRVRSAAAFAMLAGTAPVPASSGQTVRHRLNRFGDRRLNRALHVVVVHRLRLDPTTQAYAARRTAEGKTPKEIRRCLAHYVARQLFRQLEGPERTHAALDSQ